MLYLKHRPRRFRQVVGQTAVTKILRNQLMRNRTGHAYLFAGDSGTGKTTVARVLAAALNCSALKAGEPCTRCVSCRMVRTGSHWDLVETNGASQRGIDETRALISKSFLAPMSNRKIYLVDEAHGLTSAAWEALLLTIEEPPPHLVWIFCTTKPEALPDTVRSRCQSFPFQPIDTRAAQEYLARVARGERAQISAGGIRFLAESSGGNLRYALTLLDQVLSANGRITGTAAVKTTVKALQLAL